MSRSPSGGGGGGTAVGGGDAERGDQRPRRMPSARQNDSPRTSKTRKIVLRKGKKNDSANIVRPLALPVIIYSHHHKHSQGS